MPGACAKTHVMGACLVDDSGQLNKAGHRLDGGLTHDQAAVHEGHHAGQQPRGRRGGPTG